MSGGWDLGRRRDLSRLLLGLLRNALLEETTVDRSLSRRCSRSRGRLLGLGWRSGGRWLSGLSRGGLRRRGRLRCTRRCWLRSNLWGRVKIVSAQAQATKLHTDLLERCAEAATRHDDSLVWLELVPVCGRCRPCVLSGSSRLDGSWRLHRFLLRGRLLNLCWKCRRNFGLWSRRRRDLFFLLFRLLLRCRLSGLPCWLVIPSRRLHGGRLLPALRSSFRLRLWLCWLWGRGRLGW